MSGVRGETPEGRGGSCEHPPSKRSEALLTDEADYCAACGSIVFYDGRVERVRITSFRTTKR